MARRKGEYISRISVSFREAGDRRNMGSISDVIEKNLPVDNFAGGVSSNFSGTCMGADLDSDNSVTEREVTALFRPFNGFLKSVTVRWTRNKTIGL